MCILKGFPTLKAKSNSGVSYPFGIWFANSTTLYVADEGSGNTGTTVAGFYTPATAANNPTAGLQKWVFNAGLGEWQLAYTLTNGLNLGAPYSVPSSRDGGVYPAGNNDGPGGTGFPWAPATDGLRNLKGVVNRDGTVTIYAITSTISGSGDQGADPNKLLTNTGHILQNPPDFQAAEIGGEGKTGLAAEAILPAVAMEFGDSVFDARVLPDESIGHRLSRLSIPEDGSFSLVGNANGCEVLGFQRSLLHGFRNNFLRSLPDFLRIMLDPSRFGINLLMFLLRDRDDLPGMIENDEPRTGGTLIDCSDVVGHGSLHS
ncbi:MAG: hypothetical protein WBD21_09885 [Candidatus Acidiferrales bacterium]